ncbi:MAG: MotA/TolQ/ExbB proton channel family protein, partial [Magnetococcus sp. DMHC-8]
MAHSMLAWDGWWHGADWIARGVLLALVLASLLSWSIIAFKMWQLAAVHRQERQVNRQLAGRRSGAPLPTVNPDQPTAHLLAVGPHRDGLAPPDRPTLESAMAQCLREQRIHLENGLTVLATIGSATPFIGLFGTVWGIMNSFS